MANTAAQLRRIRRHIERMGDADNQVSYQAMSYLIRYYGVRALDELIEASYSENPITRYRAAWALGHTHDPRAIEPLLRLTEDPNPAVRYDTTVALGILGDPRVIDVLIALGRRKHHDWPAFYAFSKLGLPAVPIMEGLLREPDSDLRGGALDVLARFAKQYRDPHCLELVRSCLGDPDAQLREEARDWLAELGVSERELV